MQGAFVPATSRVAAQVAYASLTLSSFQTGSIIMFGNSYYAPTLSQTKPLAGVSVNFSNVVTSQSPVVFTLEGMLNGTWIGLASLNLGVSTSSGYTASSTFNIPASSLGITYSDFRVKASQTLSVFNSSGASIVFQFKSYDLS